MSDGRSPLDHLRSLSDGSLSAAEVRILCEEVERLRAKVALQEAILDAVNDDIGSDYLDTIAEGLGEIDA